MSNNQTVVVQGGNSITLAGLLAVAFIVLKLTGVITWPWIWVVSPLWMPLVIFAVLAVIILVVMGIAAIGR